MKILGIDPGAGTTALILIKDGQDKLPLKVHEIKAKKGKGCNASFLRAEAIGETLLGHLNDWEPDAFVIEGYAYAKGFGMIANAEAGTMIRNAICRYWQGKIDAWVEGDHEPPPLPLYVVAPSTLKKFATGSGKAPKDQVILGVYKRWGFECPTEHIADAYALAQMGALLYNLMDGWTATKPMLEAVKVVEEAYKSG